MPSTTTELIKGKLDVVEFLRGYLTLTSAGRNFKGLCPFHHEKTPSFMVSPDRQTWHCFGCGLGGDVFTFAMRYENVEFSEALRMLAEKAGVELRHENPAEYKYTGLLYDLNDAAKNFYKKALASTPVAKEYLAKRGLTAQTIEEFEIGWAANDQDALSMELLKSNNSPQDIMQAGLAIKTERGMMYDRFRGRIMFPIHNHLGKTVGFTGRILPQIEKEIVARTGQPIAKYVNSPETAIFLKSKLLYGFWKSKDAVREAKSAFLVEGQMDFLMSYQSGVRNVIASSGTALTGEHLHAVRRLADELVVSFDNDAAGSDAAERAIDLAEANDFSVKVAVFKDVKDAADAALADPTSVKRTLDAAVPAPVFYFDKYLPKNAEGVKTREGLRALRIVLGKLKSIESPVMRANWMRELSGRTGIPERTLDEELQKVAASGIPGAGGTASAGANRTAAGVVGAGQAGGPVIKKEVHRQDLIVEELFGAALAKNDLSILDECVLFLDPIQKEIFQILKSGKRKSEDPGLDEAIGLIVLRASGDIKHEEVSALKEELAKEYYKERRKIISQAVKNAEVRGNEKELKAALEELAGLPITKE